MAEPDVDLADDFLTTIYGEGTGYAALGFKSNGKVQGRFYRWPEQADDLLADVEARAQDGDVFWSPLLRKQPKRAKGNAALRSWLWVDLDGPSRDPRLLKEIAPILVRSGRPGHLHAYVPLSEPVDFERWHDLSRLLRGRLGGDAKIADNDLLRLPGTVNYKPEVDRPLATLVRRPWKAWEPEALKDLLTPATSPTRQRTRQRPTGAQRVSRGPTPPSVKRVLRERRDVETGERSEAFYAIVRECQKQGLSVERTARLLEGHPAAERYERQGRIRQQVEAIWDKADDETTPTEDELDLVSLDEVQAKRQRWLWEGRLALNALNLISGREGTGKSTLSVYLASAVTKGTLDGELKGRPKGVIYMATEDAIEETIRPRFEAAGADMSRVWIARLIDLPDDLDKLRRAIVRHDVGMVLLDPILSAMGSTDTNKDPDLRRALEAINATAAEMSCAIVGLKHQNKREGNDSGMKMSGLLVWSQVARCVLNVHTHPQHEDDFMVSNGKNNLAAKSKTPDLHGKIESRLVQTDDGTTDVGRVSSLVASTVRLKDMESHKNALNSKNRSDRWLAEQLIRGPVDSKEIKARGELEGYSARTLERALERIGGTASQHGYGKNNASTWSLPGMSDSRASVRDGDAGVDTDDSDDTGDIDDHLDGRSSNASNVNNVSYDSHGTSRARSRESDGSEPNSRTGTHTRAWLCPDCDGPTRLKPNPAGVDITERVWIVPNHAEDCPLLLGKSDRVAVNAESGNHDDEAYDDSTAVKEDAHK